VNRIRTVLLPPALAILFAALLCAVALVISGDNPLTALTVMITQVGEGTTAVDIVNSAAVYYLAALAVAIGFQMKLFNIGIEGQYRLAACVAAIVGGAVALPPVLHTVVILLVGALVGAAWAGIAALLKAYRGVSEVISTIMLNAIAVALAAYLLVTYLRAPRRNANDLTTATHDMENAAGDWFLLDQESRTFRIKVHLCEVVEGHGAPGEVIDDQLIIACGEGAVKLVSLQREGKSAMGSEEFLRGFAVPKGAIMG